MAAAAAYERHYEREAIVVFIPGTYSAEPDDDAGCNDAIRAIRAYQRRIDAANAPPSPSPESTVDDGVPEVQPIKPRKVTELQKAKAFLSDVLSGEPKLATTVQELAAEAGISQRKLRRAVKALKVKVRKNGRGPWFWGMVRTELESGQDAKVAG
jgi:hypothetical protein